METIDLFFRFAAIGVLGLLCLEFLIGRHGGWLAVYGALFTFGIAAYLVCSSPYVGPRLGGAFYPLLVAAIANPVLFYLFSRTLFDDDFRPSAWHGAVLAILEATVFLRIGAVVAPGEPLDLTLFAVNRAISLGIAGFAVVRAFHGRADDLVEGRRRFRGVFVAVVGTYVILVLSIEVPFSDGSEPIWLDLLNAGAILIISATIALYVLAIRTELLIAPARPPSVAPAQPPADDAVVTATQEPPSIDPTSRRLIEALRHAMEADRLYRQEGLTIAALAKQLGTQEHRLRRVINQHLGYRNFTAYLNQHRIAEIGAALADPAKAHLPVLTIAMDAGYRSLGPFNAAFKLATGLTPTEYRRARLANLPPPV